MTTPHVRALGPDDWTHIERLFGPDGASEGCWCMSLRLIAGDEGHGERGAVPRRLFRERVCSSRAHGVLAFAGHDPIGWCSYEPRAEFPELCGLRSDRVDHSEGIWSIGCFFVAPDWRHRGVSDLL